MENIPLADNTVDCIISNGAFCLAPNKRKSFEEIKRVLKPGGRFSIACTTLLQTLDESTKWPICMQVFMPLKEAKPLLTALGFTDVEVDMSDTKMTVEIEMAKEGNAESTSTSNDCIYNSDINNCLVDDHGLSAKNIRSSGRKGIHIGSVEFEHLNNFDMNKLCARVVLYGKTP